MTSYATAGTTTAGTTTAGSPKDVFFGPYLTSANTTVTGTAWKEYEIDGSSAFDLSDKMDIDDNLVDRLLDRIYGANPRKVINTCGCPYCASANLMDAPVCVQCGAPLGYERRR